MAFDVSGIATWNNELADRSEWILKPILGSTSMKYLTNKKFGIQGQNVLIPNLESTVLAQGGYSCGFNSSGTTTISQTTVTSVPFTVQEKICIRDLEKLFTVQTLPNKSQLDSWQMTDMWVNRKLAQVSRKLGQAIWQGKTTYTNDTWLKLLNGYVNAIDAGAGEITVTGGAAGTAITTSNVRTIFEEALFNNTTGVNAIPVILDANPICYCGRDTFSTLRLKLMQDNLYHVLIGTADSPDTAYKNWEMYYPGSSIKIVGLPELNASNGVETGSLPTAVKNRIIVTYQDNLIIAMNAENDIRSFDVWYSKDNDELRCTLRGFVGVAVQHNDLIVTY